MNIFDMEMTYEQYVELMKQRQQLNELIEKNNRRIEEDQRRRAATEGEAGVISVSCS